MTIRVVTAEGSASAWKRTVQPSAVRARPVSAAGLSSNAPRRTAAARRRCSNRTRSICHPGPSRSASASRTIVSSLPQALQSACRGNGPSAMNSSHKPMSDSSRRTAPGSDSPIRQPGRRWRSRTRTRQKGARLSAAIDPAVPAPMITASKSTGYLTGTGRPRGKRLTFSIRVRSTPAAGAPRSATASGAGPGIGE